MTRLSRVLSVVALAVGGAVVAGCGTGRSSSDVVSVTDSEGIGVVENGRVGEATRCPVAGFSPGGRDGGRDVRDLTIEGEARIVWVGIERNKRPRRS